MARTPTSKPPRQRRTPQQRAQHDLDVATRELKRLTKKTDGLRAELEVADQDRVAQAARLEYLAKHPDLTPRPTSTGPIEETR